MGAVKLKEREGESTRKKLNNTFFVTDLFFFFIFIFLLFSFNEQGGRCCRSGGVAHRAEQRQRFTEFLSMASSSG